MIIRIADIRDQDKWDEYILAHPDASPYHLFAWKMTVEGVYNYKGFYLMAEEDGMVHGILPLIYLKLPFLSGQLISLPFCDLGGLLANSIEIQENLIMESVALGSKLKAGLIELRSCAVIPSFQVKGLSRNTQNNKVRMELELPQSSEQLWSSFKSKLRSQIRKAEKNGLIFFWGGFEQVDEFYQVFSENMRGLGSPVHSKKLFKCILRHYGKNARMGLVYYNKKPVGGGIILSAGKKLCIPWASTLEEYNRLSPNMLLYWNFLKYAADNGYCQFDFGRSTFGQGTYKFKTQWGAKPLPLYWNYLVMNGKELKVGATTSGKRQKVEYIWRKLPLALTNCIGPAIRKHISL